jgi:methionyl-tRNA formyltransferase
MEFDLLISNGCPVVLPVTKLKKDHQLFLNVHPSLLPEFRGCHPANGALLYNAKEVGATLHTMVDRVDRGGIISQERFPLTPDLDLGLLYHLLFEAEARVFRNGIRKLFDLGFDFEGELQPPSGSHYRRAPEDMRVHFETMGNEEILRRIRAFGISSQGALCTLDGLPYKLFEAQAVTHPFLLELHASKAPGSVVLNYDGSILVRTLESFIRISKFSKM